MLCRVLVSAYLLAASALVQAGPALTSRAISEQIRTLGAGPTLQAIYDNDDKWSQLLAGIATGTKEWLCISNQLHPASDAGSSEQLGLAVGEALEHSPENVLSLAITEFGVWRVCGEPDVDDDRFNSYKLSMAAIDKRLKMVQSVKNKSLRQVRDSCLARLEEARVSITQFYGTKK